MEKEEMRGFSMIVEKEGEEERGGEFFVFLKD